MSPTPLRVGVAGAGWVASARHAPAIAKRPDATIVAVLDHNLDRAGSLAVPHGAQATTNADDFFNADLDLAVVCTPPWSHSELSMQAFESSADVLCEKPMAMSLTEAVATADAARAAGRVYVISHNFLFSRAMAQFHVWRERLGDVHYVSATQLSSYRRRLPSWHEKLPVGLFFDELPHLIYTVDHILGATEPLSVRRVEPSDTATVIEVELASATAPARITTVLGAPVSEWHITIVGEGGVVDLDLFRDIAMFVGSDGAHEAKDILKTSASAIFGHASGFVRSGVQLARHRLTWGHEELVNRTLDSCLGRAAPPVTIDDAISVATTTQRILDLLNG